MGTAFRLWQPGADRVRCWDDERLAKMEAQRSSRSCSVPAGSLARFGIVWEPDAGRLTVAYIEGDEVTLEEAKIRLEQIVADRKPGGARDSERAQRILADLTTSAQTA